MKKTSFFAAICAALVLTACGKQNAYNDLPEAIREFVITENDNIDKDFDEEGLRFDGIVVEGQNIVMVHTIDESPAGFDMSLSELIIPSRSEEAKRESIYDVIAEIGEDKAAKLFAECQEYNYDLIFRLIGSKSQEKYELIVLHCDLNIEEYNGIEYQVYLKEKDQPWQLRQPSLKNSLMERLSRSYTFIEYLGYQDDIPWWFLFYSDLQSAKATPSDLSPYISVYDFNVDTESQKFTTFSVIYEIDSKALWESADYVKYCHSENNEDADQLGTATSNYLRTHKGHNMYIYAEVTIENETGAWKQWRNFEKSINPNDFYE